MGQCHSHPYQYETQYSNYLHTNLFKVDFLFNFLEVCEAKFLQESPEVSKKNALAGAKNVLKSVNQIAARTESSHGEEETEQVQARPRQV